MKKRIIVAGGGIAGLNAAKAARDQSPDSNITILEEGSLNTYVRTRLPDYISGEASVKELFPYDDSWYASNNITLSKNTKITGLDGAKKIIYTDKGQFEFDALVIALGSSGNVPPIPGVDLENCFTVRTIADADRIRKLSGTGITCTIIGGGLLGLEMAWSIRQMGCEVNVIESFPRLLPRQIDEQGAVLLQKEISAKGIKLFLNAQVQHIGGSGKVEYVKLNDGTEVKSDFIILSTGVKANIQPVASSGLDIGRCIKVDEHMRTNIEDIYAAGDIAEYNGKSFGIWPIAVSQGKVAGNNAAGGNMEYTEVYPFTSLKIKGITLFSIGDVYSEDAQAITELDTEKGRYVKLLVKDGIITAAIVVGDPGLPMAIKKAVDRKTKLPEITEGISIKELIEKL